MRKRVINEREYRAALARMGWTQWRLAAHLGFAPSSVSAFIHGRTPAPLGFVARVEEALGLEPGALAPVEDEDREEGA